MPKFAGVITDITTGKYFLKKMKRYNRFYLIPIIMLALIQSMYPILMSFAPKLLVDEFLGKNRYEILIKIIALIVVGNMILSIISKALSNKIELANKDIINNIELELIEHISKLDFKDLENPEVLELKEKALFTVTTQNSISKLIDSMIALIKSVIGISVCIAIMGRINLGILIIVFLVSLLNTAIQKKMQNVEFKLYEDIVPANRKFMYYSGLVTDSTLCKDIKIYKMEKMLLHKISTFNKSMVNGIKNTLIKSGKLQGLISFNISIQDMLINIYLIYQVAVKGVTIGSFLMFSSISKYLSMYTLDIFSNWILFRQMCKYLSDYKAFENLSSSKEDYRSSLKDLAHFTIEFKNVYFKYPGSDSYALNNVSIKFKNGDKIALVGENGSGKTTFIKLICRLYKPSKGEILLNGVNIEEFNFDEYVRILGVVFQDYKLISNTIKNNIIVDNNYDEDKMSHILNSLGLYDKLNKLERKLDSTLFKFFDYSGIVLSGGDSQKIAIARAMYKDSKVIIMDEPTAALDPYIENEIFTNLNKLTTDKLAIYISHRLSSCCFCEQIYVFENGQIIEKGSHEELMNDSYKYKLLWNSQAKLYSS